MVYTGINLCYSVDEAVVQIKDENEENRMRTQIQDRRRRAMICTAHMPKAVLAIYTADDVVVRAPECRNCNALLELCTCIADGEGDADQHCKVCNGTGWVKAQSR